MAKCEFCGKEMLKAESCDFSKLSLKSGKVAARQKVGEEGYFSEGKRCGDCGAMYGGYHHFGCDIERCPFCGEQLISCYCEIDCLLR